MKKKNRIRLSDKVFDSEKMKTQMEWRTMMNVTNLIKNDI